MRRLWYKFKSLKNLTRQNKFIHKCHKCLIFSQIPIPTHQSSSSLPCKTNMSNKNYISKYVTSTNKISNTKNTITPVTSKISCFPKAHDVRLHISASRPCCLWSFGHWRSVLRPGGKHVLHHHPWDWYIYLHEWWISMINVGKYICKYTPLKQLTIM